MSSGLLIRLRPVGPWRIGPDSGDRDRVDRIYHSDSLYSAITSAMSRLDILDTWLNATARVPEPAVRFSSCFPYQGDTLLVVPPRNLWPPPPSSKVRWKGARFVPLSVVESLAAGRGLSEDGWIIDGPSECLLPFSTPPVSGPFRVSVRSSAAVDREGAAVSPHSTACLEFTPGSGLWCVVHFSDNTAREQWAAPLTAAFRLLSDSGFGGKRSQGWGRAEMPEIAESPGELQFNTGDAGQAYWLLSLFHPAASDTVEWSQGNYIVTTRGGRVESDSRWGDHKKQTRMVAEGSVLVAASEPRGAAADVAPEGFPHPVYRSGFALAIAYSAQDGIVKYRVTCLTPTLVGDGQKLAPIDYMVWKEHVNVLDQRRIFRLLAKGPRLDGYLAQLKTSDKLDFASWGGFAQNFAGRRIPFEHASSVPVWERAQAPNLFIPTFATSPSGPYLPATAIKGALRTGAVFDRWNENTLRELAGRMEDDRPPRNPAAKAEDAVLGGHAGNRMRRVGTADSMPVTYTGMKVYLLRVSTLVARGAGKFELGWKSVRGTADARRIEESTPAFAEMAAPGMAFEGLWRENSAQDRQKLFQAANSYAISQIQRHKAYADLAGLDRLATALGDLEKRVQAAGNAAGNDACVLALGWGAGMLSKISVADTADPNYRAILRHVSLFQKAVQTGLPFPKTRRIVFEGGRPAYLPGWVLLEVN